MRSLRFDSTTFISEYKQAVSAGLTATELAHLLGVTYSCLCCRKHALKKRGIHLPPLRRTRGSGRRKAAREMIRLIAPVQAIVEPVPMTFTMSVGCGHG